MQDDYLKELAEDIELIGDRREVLELMVSLGKQLNELAPEEQTPQNLVPGCVSNVHVIAELGQDGRVYFRGSSQAHIVRGYVQALFEQFNGWDPDRFLTESDKIVADFLQRTNLAQSILPTRANSIGNILKTMKKQVLQLKGGE